MPWTLDTAPASEPVTVAEFKTWIGYGGSDLDTQYTNLLLAARQWVEEYTWRQLITATWIVKLHRFPRTIILPKPPLGAVSSIQYVDQNGTTQTLASSKYQVSGDEPGIVIEAYNETWPITRSVLDAVTITFTAGYGASSSDVPESIREAILLIAQSWNNAIVCDESKIPMAAKSMLEPYRLRDSRMLQGA